MKQKYDILVLSPFFSPNIGGVETHLDDWVEYLSSKKVPGLVVTFQPITIDQSAPKYEQKGSIDIFRFSWIGRNLFHKLEPFPIFEFLYLTPYLFLCLLYTYWIKGARFKTIHAHGLNAAFVSVLFKILFGIPSVLSTHAVYAHSRSSMTARIASRVMNRLNSILCLSNASKDQLLDFGVMGKKLKRFTYWIDLEKFRLTDQRREQKALGLPDRFTIIFVGRLIPAKGIHPYLEIAEKKPEWNFMVIGTGPLESEVDEIARKNDNIYFYGKQPNDALPSFFNAADSLVISSQYEEGFGRVIIEALACGCSVVGNRRGGIVEALSHGGGILVDGTNAEAYEEALCRIELQKNDRRATADLAREHYSQRNGNQILKSLMTNAKGI